MNTAQADSGRREVSLLAVWSYLARRKATIGPCMLAGAIAAGALAFFVMTPKYRAEIVFSPVNSTGSLSGEIGASLGGLAALAGLNIGGAGKRADESLEYLRSREFTRGFIERHGLMPVLFASKWDAVNKRWHTDDPPTIWQGVNRFSKKIRQIAEDHRTGIVTMAIIWKDRVAAAQWANAMIAEADTALRQRAIAEHTRSLDYLTSEANEAAAVEVRAAIFKTMESELKDSMLARTRDAYAFRVLDPAVVRDPHDTDSPNKPLIITVGAIVGLLLGMVVAAVRERRSRARQH
jgi:LPS O-antigen subunit length determinant protein (WzzB/FepE family)